MTNIAVQPEVEQMIDRQLSLGRYASESEVVFKAMRALEAELSTLEAIQRGIDDCEQGRMISLEQLQAKIKERFGFDADDQPDEL